jgi:hypothetical protein
MVLEVYYPFIMTISFAENCFQTWMSSRLRLMEQSFRDSRGTPASRCSGRIVVVATRFLGLTCCLNFYQATSPVWLLDCSTVCRGSSSCCTDTRTTLTWINRCWNRHPLSSPTCGVINLRFRKVRIGCSVVRRIRLKIPIFLCILLSLRQMEGWYYLVTAP